jgi:parallel beta-helix repeat protein
VVALLFAFVLSFISIEPLAAATYHVDRGNPAASDTNDGSAQLPWKTISKAASTVVAGDVVIVRKGIYREFVDVKNSGSPGNMITLMAHPGDIVEIRGSELVTGWEIDGDTPVWKKTGWTDPSQMVIVDSNLPLNQLGVSAYAHYDNQSVLKMAGSTRAEMFPGSFFHDAADNTLYVWLPWNRPIHWHMVEASVRDVVFRTNEYAHISGFKMMHNNLSHAGSMAGLVQLGSHSVMEDCEIRLADFAGVLATGPVTLRRNIINQCGNSGIHMTQADDSLLEGNITNFNNWRQFELGWHSGGMKITGSKNVTVREHVSAYNSGPGIWFDIDCADVTIENCVTRGNSGPGIHYEISYGSTVIRNNLCVDDRDMSIWISGSSGVKVERNTCVNSNQGIVVNGVPREHYKLTDNSIRWNVSAFCWQSPLTLMPDDGDLVAGNSCDNNLYFAPGAEPPYFKTDWHDGFRGLDEWRAQTQRDEHSVLLDPGFSDMRNGDYGVSRAARKYGADTKKLPSFGLTTMR